MPQWAVCRSGLHFNIYSVPAKVLQLLETSGPNSGIFSATVPVSVSVLVPEYLFLISLKERTICSASYKMFLLVDKH